MFVLDTWSNMQPYSQPHLSQPQVDSICVEDKYPETIDNSISLSDMNSIHTSNCHLFCKSNDVKDKNYSGPSSSFIISPHQNGSLGQSDSSLSVVYETVPVSNVPVNQQAIDQKSGPLTSSRTPQTAGARYPNKSVPPLHINVEYPPLRTADGKFKCRECGRQYTQMKHLRRHAIMHTGKTPYGCSYCHKRFNRLDICKRHITTCSARKKAACQLKQPPPQSSDSRSVLNSQLTKPIPVPMAMEVDIRYPSCYNKFYSYQANSAAIPSNFGYFSLYDQHQHIPMTSEPLPSMFHSTSTIKPQTQGLINHWEVPYYNTTNIWSSRSC